LLLASSVILNLTTLLIFKQLFYLTYVKCIMELHDKLVQIQFELKAPKSQKNSFGKYNYRSAEDILESLKPHLKKYGLSLTLSDDIKELDTGIPYVVATATLSDGENVLTATSMAGIDPNKKGQDLSQTFGSASSYARKYAMNGLFMIDDTKDADATNDHGKGSKGDSEPSSSSKPSAKPLMTKTQFDNALKAYNNGDESVKNSVRERLESKYTLTEEQVKTFFNKAK